MGSLNVSDLMKAMADAGAPFEAILVAVRALEEKDAVIEARRAGDRERKRRQRGTVTGQSRDTGRTVTDAPPVLDKEIPPRPPKEINPTPRATRAGALARKAGGFGPPEGVALQTWNEFCGQRKKAISDTAYSRMLNTLAEAADAGWPPGEIVERSIEKTWETLFIPTERRNGQRPANDHRPSRRADEIDDAFRTLGFSG